MTSSASDKEGLVEDPGPGGCGAAPWWWSKRLCAVVWVGLGVLVVVVMLGVLVHANKELEKKVGSDELRDELRGVRHEELRGDVREELRGDVREELRGDVREGGTTSTSRQQNVSAQLTQLREQLREELRDELRELREENAALKLRLENVDARLTNLSSSEPELRQLREEVRDELRDLRRELDHSHAAPQTQVQDVQHVGLQNFSSPQGTQIFHTFFSISPLRDVVVVVGRTTCVARAAVSNVTER